MIDEDYVPLTKRMKPDSDAHAMRRKQKQDVNILQLMDGPYEAQVIQMYGCIML
jgi:hypothetical protein